MEKQNFWQTQLFESSEILLRSRAVRIFLNVRNLWMCRVGTALFLRFCPLHFARHPALGLGGNEFLNGFSKYFSAYLKAKVIYVTVNPSFRKSDDSRAGVGMSRRCLKNMQKLRQKIFEDHLRPPPANCFDKQTIPTDHKTILRRHLISKYWNMNPLSCMRGKWSNFFGRKQLPGYSCQVSPLYRPIFWRCEVQSIWLPFVKMSPKLCSPGSRCFHQQLCINWKPCGLLNDKIYTNQNSYCTSYRISGKNVNWEASGIWHFVNTEWKFL